MWVKGILFFLIKATKKLWLRDFDSQIQIPESICWESYFPHFQSGDAIKMWEEHWLEVTSLELIWTLTPIDGQSQALSGFEVGLDELLEH
jgi:hypothetical protein